MTPSGKDPVGKLDTRFSFSTAKAIEWPVVRDALATAMVYWATTVRADGRPHGTPVIAIWFGGALYFSTGPDEQKARNLERNQHCAVCVGDSSMDGLDVVVEGDAVRVTDPGVLLELAVAFNAKYDDPFSFSATATGFANEDGSEALVFVVRAQKVLAFAKAPTFGQTTFRL